MTSSFILSTTNNKIIVYSTNYYRMEEYMAEVESILKEMNYEGNVIFDLLLSNGYAFNRFIEMYFNGEKFNIKSTKIYEANLDMLTESLEFYSENMEYVKNSNLTPIDKFMIKKKNLKQK